MPSQAADPYLSTAFYSQYNLILLGGSALFALASASLWPLALGVAAEVMWLGLGPRSKVLRRRVEARAAEERRAAVEDQISQGMASLLPENASRLLGVGHNISWIGMRADGVAMDEAEQAALLELERLRPAFMRLCQLRERVQQRLEEFRQAPPEQEVAELSRLYSAEKDLGQRFTLHQGVKAAQKKIEQQARFTDVQRQVELKLTVVEQTLAQLRNQQQLGQSDLDLGREVEGLLQQVMLIPALEAELEGS